MPEWLIALLSALLGGATSFVATLWGVRSTMKNALVMRTAELRQTTYLDFLKWYDEAWGFLLTVESGEVDVATYRKRQIPEALLARLAIFGHEGFAEMISQYREVGDWIRQDMFDAADKDLAKRTVTTAQAIVRAIRSVVARNLGTESPEQVREDIEDLRAILTVWRLKMVEEKRFTVVSDVLRQRHKTVKEAINRIQ